MVIDLKVNNKNPSNMLLKPVLLKVSSFPRSGNIENVRL
jgi:hypothetical protein